jgi:hypothetical protein
MSKPEEFKFDSRVRDRFLRSRVLNGPELQKHLDELPDLEGEYEVMSDTPQPAVTPPRSEVHEEPLVFDGIRRLQALSEAQSPPPAPRYVPPSPPSGGLPSYREPESRPLGTPLRSALMESEISGVGAGAVSAALGAMAAEARGASVFGVPASIPQPPPPAEDAVPPVTLRSETSGQPLVPRAEVAPIAGGADAALAVEDEDDTDEDEDEDDDEDDTDEDDADDEGLDEAEADADSDGDEDEDDDEDDDGAAEPEEEDLA